MSAAENRRLSLARDEAKLHLANHDRGTSQGADIIERYDAARIDIAAGEQPPAGTPSLAEYDEACSQRAIAPQVRLRLQAKVNACEAAFAKAVANEKDLKRDAGRASALEPAIAECKQAAADYFNSLIKVAAAHALFEREFNSQARPVDSPEDYFGPAAHILCEFQNLPWENWPYSLRPDWLPTNRYYPDSFKSFHEHSAEMRARAEQVLA
ncbi:hypothetical protein NF700_17570 [Sphingomonadaceae bacterium OTU29MARTA1]|nr:hypothetical protein NF700_17570 [Sphingomonadaceae bacterium OTU29MARTA1]